jgi:hypothetical protein
MGAVECFEDLERIEIRSLQGKKREARRGVQDQYTMKSGLGDKECGKRTAV